MYNILIAEDEESINFLMKLTLEKEGYKIFSAKNGNEAVEIFKHHNIDLVIMDLMMPVMTGEEAIEKIREISYTPIIIVSAKDQNNDKIKGLRIGADDYLTKPFNEEELVARVNSLIRRTYNYTEKNNDETISISGLSLDKNEKCVYVDGEKKVLTKIEFEILKFLMENPNQVFSTGQIYQAVWNEPAFDTKTVSVHIKRIRDKIEIDSKNPRYIQVVWGMGYKFTKNGDMNGES
ncbi:MAG: response regulator transcription factor [Peptoniphilaceae bacterium]|nr:response regulator transcription factor [Peptoniphilaceae bacterium]MDD7382981.1 response regulator transcription factor [Peptoniphilaceae bacterium]MDY3737732.1 response regulator transcription factor [Peptoniphilaceae bacterium]